jgi:hypothetical protein
LGNTRIGVFPELKERLVLGDRFAVAAGFLIRQAQIIPQFYIPDTPERARAGIVGNRCFKFGRGVGGGVDCNDEANPLDVTYLSTMCICQWMPFMICRLVLSPSVIWTVTGRSIRST